MCWPSWPRLGVLETGVLETGVLEAGIRIRGDESSMFSESLDRLLAKSIVSGACCKRRLVATNRVVCQRI